MSEADHLHKYLKEKNLHAIFVKLTEEVLKAKPDNPIGFIVELLLKTYQDECKGIMRNDMQPPPSLVVAKQRDEEGLSDSSSDDGNEILTDESVVLRSEGTSLKAPAKKKRRESVSAEKLPDASETELKVFAKTEEETLRINNILQSNVFFSHLDEHQRRALGDSMFVVESRDGDTIISQNDDGDNMYLIDEGRVECYIQKDNEEERILVKTLGDGDLFGELALLYSAPRAATCIAKGEASLFALDRVSFNVILQQTTIAKREKMVAFLKKVPVMSLLTQYELLTVADCLEEASFADSDVVIEQGDVGDKFYLIKSGTAVCSVSGEKGVCSTVVARLESGDFFGEIALLTTKPRQATVTAEGTLQCFYLSRRRFARVMGTLTELLTKNLDEKYHLGSSLVGSNNGGGV